MSLVQIQLEPPILEEIMDSKPIAQLEREASEARQRLADAMLQQENLSTAVRAAIAVPGSQYINLAIPRGIGKSTMLRDAAHTWALQFPSNTVTDGSVFRKTKLVIYLVPNLRVSEEVKVSRLGRAEYMVTDVVVTCDTSENPHVLTTQLCGKQYEEVLIVLDEISDLQVLVNIYSLLLPKVLAKDISIIALASKYREQQ